MLPETLYFSFLIAVFGACIASFLDCAAYRTAHGLSVFKGRSVCDGCGRVLSAVELIPVFGFCFSCGKCKKCGCRIPVRYPVGEAVFAAVSVGLFLRFGFTAEFPMFFLFLCVLFLCSSADLHSRKIPNQFIVYGIAIRFIFVLLSGNILSNVAKSLIGGISAALPVFFIAWIAEKISGRKMIGMGDIKLLFVTGLFLGWQGSILCLFFTCVFFIIAFVFTGKRRKEAMPLAPFIAAASAVSVLFGNDVFRIYLSFFDIL